MAILGFELDEIARLLALADSQGLSEIILEEEDRLLRIRGANYVGKSARSASVAAPPSLVPAITPRVAPRSIAAPPASLAPKDSETEALLPLASPMVGVFYRASQPGAPPIAQVGQRVSVGDTIGIIEAMKIFSEVPAEHSGVIVSFPAKDGQLVQAGQPLALLKVE